MIKGEHIPSNNGKCDISMLMFLALIQIYVIIIIDFDINLQINVKFKYNIFKYDLFRDFIDKDTFITADAFKYFFEKNISELLENYHRIKRNPNPIEYCSILPIHSNGIPKKYLDYFDFIDQKNINIKHFSEYIENGDKNEFDQRPFTINSLNGPTKITNRRTKFTLIYAIGCHKANQLLTREINALSHEEVCFILFYDYRSNRTELYERFSKEINNKKFENVYIVDSPRFQVNWGTITQSLIQLVMMQAALKFFPESLYISFHSGSDYPIVPNDVIVSFLKQNYPKNYINTIPPSEEKWKARRKNEFYLFFDSPQKDAIVRMIKRLFPNKIIPKAKWRSGRNWFTMTLKDSKLMMEVADKRFDIIETLDYTLHSDEVIFDTFAAEADIPITYKYLRYVNWKKKSCHPTTITEEYYDDVIGAQCSFWARKFDDNESIKVLGMIDEYNKQFSQAKKDDILKYC